MEGASQFRNAMRAVAGTVVIATTSCVNGARHGLTATSMCSLSADSPSLLVCINAASSLGKVLRQGGNLAVNVVSSDQENIANVFAGRTGQTGDSRFATGRWRQGQTGAPINIDACVAFDCKIIDLIPKFTHIIVVAEVREILFGQPMMAPLLYCEGRYRSIGPNTCATVHA